MKGTLARVLTAIVLIPLVVSLVLWGPTWLVAIVVAGIILLALHEFFALGAKMNMPGYPRFAMLCAFLFVMSVGREWIAWSRSSALVTGFWMLAGQLAPSTHIFAGFLVGLAVLTLKSRRATASALADCSISSAGMMLIAWPLSRLVVLHAIEPVFLLFTLVLVWAGDTAAFFVGRVVGKRRLAPVISPRKTWEGAVANVLGSLLVGYAISWWRHFPLVHALVVAVLVSVAGQIGDLFESAWKRGAGVKDSGTLLPGHGGILDRIDALLLAAPVVWWYFSSVPVFLPKP